MIAGLLGCSDLWLDVFDLLVSRVHCGRLVHVYLVGSPSWPSAQHPARREHSGVFRESSRECCTPIQVQWW
jgi:hypothetical protein